MIRLRFQAFAVLLVAVVLGGAASAQQQPPKISASFYCFRYAKGLEDVYVRTGDAAFKKIELSTANMIGPIPVVVEKGFVAVHTIATDGEGKTIYPVAGRAKVGVLRKPLVILFPGAKGAKLPYDVLMLDRSEARFPLGSYKFVNLATFPIRAAIGKSILKLNPGGVKTLKPKGSPGQMINVIFEFHDGKQWRPMTQTRWAIRPDKRILSCAYLDPTDKRVKLRAIPERLVPPAPKNESKQ
jgi:hypothetical protein